MITRKLTIQERRHFYDGEEIFKTEGADEIQDIAAREAPRYMCMNEVVTDIRGYGNTADEAYEDYTAALLHHMTTQYQEANSWRPD